MKTRPTLRQQFSVACRTCGVAAGKRCVLIAGGLRNEAHPDWKLLAAEALEKNRTRKR